MDSLALSAADTAAAKAATKLLSHSYRSKPGAKPASAAPPTIQYPEDLGYGGGPVLTNVTEHNVYVSVDGTTPHSSTWGNPHKFLSDLGKSNFIHVTDQYIKGAGAPLGTYLPGASIGISNTNFGFAPLYDNDILALVHAAAKHVKQNGETGYERIYNVFLPPGVDTCFTFTTACYSPDNPSTDAFCAYHSSVTFNDLGHVIYTVEPYQASGTCSILDPSDPKYLESTTDSNLSHEIFEAITDPDPGFPFSYGWVVPYSNGGVAYGYEIGDLCAYAQSQASTLNGTTYNIQPEYSNAVHACVNDNITAASRSSRQI